MKEFTKVFTGWRGNTIASQINTFLLTCYNENFDLEIKKICYIANNEHRDDRNAIVVFKCDHIFSKSEADEFVDFTKE